MHEATYSLDDWKASEKSSFLQDRLKWQLPGNADPEDFGPAQALPGLRQSRRGGDDQRLGGVFHVHTSKAASVSTAARATNVLNSRTPDEWQEQQTTARATKVLNSMTPDEWDALTKNGAPEAWVYESRMKGSKRFNNVLRTELAHISRLRQKSGAQSVPLARMEERSMLSSTSSRPRWMPGSSQHNESDVFLSKREGTAAPERGKWLRRSMGKDCSKFDNGPANTPLLLASSMTLPEPLSLKEGETAVVTPNTWRKQLFGTESRPSTMMKLYDKRQSHAGIHLVWSVPKKFDAGNVVERELEHQLVADRKAAQVKRKALVKQVLFNP